MNQEQEQGYQAAIVDLLAATALLYPQRMPELVETVRRVVAAQKIMEDLANGR